MSAILVTHDQTEAYTFADRMILLSQGKVVQNGSPEEVYHEPATAWVASFVGEANLVPLELVGSAIGLENISQMPKIAIAYDVRLEDIKITARKPLAIRLIQRFPMITKFCMSAMRMAWPRAKIYPERVGS